MHYYLKYSKEKIKLAAKPFAGGGEGNLYKILSPKALSGYVAKIYHPQKLNKERQEKIHYLYNNPPKGLQEGQHPAFIWVKDVLYDEQKNFKGFIMPFIQGEKLEVLTYAKLPKHLGPEWKRFDLRDPNSFDLRLRICFNLAAALYHIHSTQHYVVVDLKPENVVIQPNGLVSLVDMDSVEVVEEDRVRFPAPVATPEYTPPEHYRNESRSHQFDAIDADWDIFALAVIFYKLLFGIHPFTASAKAPYDNAVSLHEKIQHGLFVHHPAQKELFHVIPPPHQAFEKKLKDEMKTLFLQTFVVGHQQPGERPIAEVWCMALLQALGDEKMLAHFQNLFKENISRNRSLSQPSIVTRLPNVVIQEKALIPNDYHLILEWVPPTPKPKLPQKPTDLKLSLNNGLVMLLSSFATIFIVGILSAFSTHFYRFIFNDLWELSTLQTTLYLQIGLLFPTIIFPLFFTGLRYFFDKKIRAWRQLKRIANKVFNNFDKNKEAFLKLKEGIKTKLEEVIEPSAFRKQLSARQADFKNWLQEQDEVYNLVTENEIKAQQDLLQKHLDQLCALPSCKGLKANSFQEIRTFIQEEKAKLLAQKSIKIPDHAEILKIPEIAEKLRAGENALQRDRTEAFRVLEEKFAHFQHQIEDEIKTLTEQLNQFTKIAPNASTRFEFLKKYSNAFVQLFHKKGIFGILDIDRIDYLSFQLFLKNGTLVSFANEADTTILASLFSSLGPWRKEALDFEQKIKDEKLKIKQKKSRAEREFEIQKAKKLAFFEEKRRSLAEQLEQQMPTLYLEYRQKETLQAFSNLENMLTTVEAAFEHESKILQATFELEHQEILARCQNAAIEKQAELEELIKLEEKGLDQKISLAGLDQLKKESLKKINQIEKVAKAAQKAEENYLKYVP